MSDHASSAFDLGQQIVRIDRATAPAEPGENLFRGDCPLALCLVLCLRRGAIFPRDPCGALGVGLGGFARLGVRLVYGSKVSGTSPRGYTLVPPIGGRGEFPKRTG